MKVINAIEYQAVGIDSYECNEWIDPFDRVEEFLSLFLQIEYFEKIMILYSGSKSLRNWKKLGVVKQEVYRIIYNHQEAIDLKNEIKLACISHGHMSVLFFPQVSSGFIDKFIEIGSHELGQHVILGTGGKNDFLMKEQLSAYTEFLPSYLDNKRYACVFSHDADYFFQITGASKE